MRALTRLGIVVESISKFARELERYHPGLHEQISKEVIRRYVDREGNGAFANTAPSVSKRRLGEAGQYLLALVLQFRDTAAAKLFSFAILERVLRDQFEIVDDEYGDRDATRAAIRDPKDVPCDTVGNPADPDASYNAHKGQQPVEKGVIDRVSRHGEAYRGEGGFAILRDDEDDLNDQDGSSGRNKHEQGANSARHGLLRGAGADELAHQQR